VAGAAYNSATLASKEYLPRFDFTMRNFSAYVSANTIATSDTNFYIVDNGSNSAVTFAYSAAQTGVKTDTSNTVSITGGTDEIAYSVVAPNTSGAITIMTIAAEGDTDPPAEEDFIPRVIFM
jgi:hypothetical protein